MANYEFKFKRGTEVAAHMTQFHNFLKYTERLPGEDTVQNFESKMITFDSFPKAWKQSFLNKGNGLFDACTLVNIFQHMVGLAVSSANNDEKNKKDKKNNDGNGQRAGRS